MKNKQLKASGKVKSWEWEKHKIEEKTWNFKENILLDFPKHEYVIHSFTQRTETIKKYFVLFEKTKQNT